MSGADEEKRSELMKSNSQGGGEGEGTMIDFLLRLYMSGKG